MHLQLAAELDRAHGVLDRRKHPGLRHQVDHAVRQGLLVRVLPNVYARPADAGTLETRARAACLSDPDAVVTGRAAAEIGGWTDLGRPTALDVATPRVHDAWRGVRLERRRIPRSLVRTVDGVRITTFPLTALDLALREGPARLDDALRRGVELGRLRDALAATPGRRGYATLRRELDLVRDRPWSRLECAAHVLLRDAAITGWRANRAISAGPGDRIGYGDLVFEDLWLVVELDGVGHHSAHGDVARDRARDLRMARLGWEVLRLGSAVVFRSPEQFVAIVRDLVRTRQRRLPKPAGPTLDGRREASGGRRV